MLQWCLFHFRCFYLFFTWPFSYTIWLLLASMLTITYIWNTSNTNIHTGVYRLHQAELNTCTETHHRFWRRSMPWCHVERSRWTWRTSPGSFRKSCRRYDLERKLGKYAVQMDSPDRKQYILGYILGLAYSAMQW